MKYDYLIVGAGLYGSSCARVLKDMGKTVVVVEKRKHIAGNMYTENVDGIDVHKYGAHVFHTNNKQVWGFVNRYSKFNNYKHNVKANFKGELFDLPFNMNTFKKIWNISTVDQAKAIIYSQSRGISNPKNLEETCISMVGTDIYNMLVKGYTEKQWGRECKDLPSFIIQRIPVRFEYNNNYYNSQYQGIPVHGYTNMVEKMLEGIKVLLNYDFLKNRHAIDYNQLIYTGSIDAFFDYKYGFLKYRSVKFEHETLNVSNYQGVSVINYTDKNVPYTRIIEHKHFNQAKTNKTIITKEYSQEWNVGREPFYPINDEENNELYEKYQLLAKEFPNIMFGGRLGKYKYMNMDEVIEDVLNKFVNN